jgi:RecB family exonuclease
MATVYSHSRLDLFESCRLRYRLKYVDRVKRDLEGVESFVGSRVHEALESLYRDVMMGRVPGLDSVIDGYDRSWDEEWSDEVVLSDPRWTAAGQRTAGVDCLRRYYARHVPFRADRTLGVEIRVGLDLPNGARLEGYADRVARDPDGWLVVHDYKTSSNLPTQADVDRDRQLALYQAGVEGMWPGAPGVRLVWHYLRFDERLVSTRSREQMEAVLGETARVVDEVEAETLWSPTVSRLCTWCPYWDLCPEKKHEWALLQKGREEPSLLPSPAPAAEAAARALEDAVAALRRGRDAEDDLEDARERLRQYGLSTGAASVTGPGGTARIRGDQVRIYPKRDGTA